MCIYQGKGRSHRTVHGGFSCLAAPPAQIGSADTSRKDKWFFRRHPRAPTNVRCIEHTVSFSISHKGLHGRVCFLSAIFLDHVRLTGFRLGFLGCLLLAQNAAVSLLSTHFLFSRRYFRNCFCCCCVALINLCLPFPCFAPPHTLYYCCFAVCCCSSSSSALQNKFEYRSDDFCHCWLRIGFSTESCTLAIFQRFTGFGRRSGPFRSLHSLKKLLLTRIFVCDLAVSSTCRQTTLRSQLNQITCVVLFDCSRIKSTMSSKHRLTRSFRTISAILYIVSVVVWNLSDPRKKFCPMFM